MKGEIMRKVILLGVILVFLSSLGWTEECILDFGPDSFPRYMKIDCDDVPLVRGDIKILETKIKELERRIYELEQKQKRSLPDLNVSCDE